MQSRSCTSAADDGPMEAALADYFNRLDRGQPVDLAELVAAHPGCEAGLRQFLQNERQLNAIGAGPAAFQVHVGQVVGDFRLIGELGRGGMGVVYEAEQLSLGRRVALKILPFAAMLDKQQLARFKNEARAAATLDHPHIVAVHAVGADGDVHYYAMQLIEGSSLAQVIASIRRSRGGEVTSDEMVDAARSTDDRDLTTSFNDAHTPLHGALLEAPTAPRDPQPSPLPDFATHDYFRTVARLGCEAAEALDHAHQSGVLHRDVKPANLLLDKSGKLWIADFGLARMEADAGLTMTGEMLGTLRYMAPEQAQAQRAVVDHRCDIYSLGATLYELLTLEPDFGETDRTRLLQQIAHDEPPAPRQINARVPRDLETIVLKAMRKSPDERYTTAQALADDLENFLNEKPINAKPPTNRERLVKWSRRHPAATWSTVLVLAATTFLSAVSAAVVGQAYRRESVQRGIAEKETQRADLERARAEKNFMQAREAIRDFLVNAARGDGVWGQLSPELRTEFSNQAAKFYETLLHEASTDPSLQHETAVGYQSLAVLHRFRQEYREAEKLFRKSLQILDRLCLEHPDVIQYRRSRALNNRMFAGTLVSVDKLDEADAAYVTAINLLKQLIKEEPGEASHLEQLYENFEGLELVRRQRKDQAWDWTGEAISVFQDVVRQCPENAAAYGVLGATLIKRGEFDKAINTLREAIRLSPEQPNFHNRLGGALSQQARWEEAVVAYRNAIRLSPADSPKLHRLHLDLGFALGQVRLFDEEIAEYREAVRVAPTAWYGHYRLGNALTKLGRYANAETTLRTALIHVPSDLHARYALAQALYQMGSVEDSAREYQSVIEGFRKSIEMHPDSWLDLHWLAGVLANCADPNVREPNEAVVLAKRAIELMPREPQTWSILGAAYYRAANYPGASEALLKSRDLGGDDVSTIFFLAMTELQLGHADAARQWYDKGVEWLNERPQIVGGDIALSRAEAEKLFHVTATSNVSE